MGTGTGSGREKAQGLAAEGVSYLGRAAGDGSPRHETHLRLAPAPAPSPDLPSLSVVCATHQRIRLLPAFVEAVLADPAAAELIVVTADEESMAALDRLREEHPRLKPLQVGRVPHHAALDAGVAAASSEIVLLMDDDVLPGPGLATGHATHHARGCGLVVMGYMPVRLAPHPHPREVGAELYGLAYDRHCHRIESGERGVLDELWTGNVSVRRADCLRVGLYSPRFPAFYHADRDLGLRLADAGLVGVFDRSLAASHLHTRTPAEFLRDSERQGSGRVALQQAQPHRLGDLDPSFIVSDLPRPVRAVVLVAGTTRLAGPTAHLMIGIGVCLGHAGLRRTELMMAKLARRVMQVRGMRTAWAEAAVTGRARNAAPRPSRSSSLPPA